MINLSLKKEILEALSRLTYNQQRRVRDFAHVLAMTKPIGVPGKALLSFAGAIEADDLKAMAQAIEKGCEKVDLNEWKK